jgi:Ca-activated chloride channel family protein
VERVLPVLALVLFSGFIDSPKSLVDKGNRNVEQKKYQSAVEDYRKAQVSQPNEPVIRYNLGTAFYELYQYRDAEKELDQALIQAKDPTTKARILYNYGNTKYRLGDFEKAIDAYKKVLDINPKDEDAKFNLEFLRKQKAQFEKKQEEQQQQKPQQRPDQQNKQDQEQPQPKPQPEKQGEQDQEQPQPQPQEGEQDKSKPQPQRGGQGEEMEGKGKEQRQEKGEEQEQQKQEDKQESEEQKQQKGRQGKEEQREQPSGREGRDRQEQGGQGERPLQGQMSKENALRILDALMEGEKQLQDLRRPPVESDSAEVLKDW